MSLEASKFRLGIFFTVGTLMFVAAMIWLTGWFKHQEARTYVMYFSESVQGLEGGSSVRYNGVPVGEVRSIQVASTDSIALVEVVVEIYTDFHLRSDMVARLDLIGITGIKLINLRIAGPGDVPQRFTMVDTPYEQIPTVKSSLETLDVGLQRLVEILNEVDVQELSEQSVTLLENLNALVGNDSVSLILHRIAVASSHIDTLAMVYTELGRNLNAMALDARQSFPDLAGNVDSLTRELTIFVTEFQPLVRQVDELLSQTYALMMQIQTVVNRLRENPEGLLLAPSQGEDEWP
jgi:phospholipid/cholesterol/gamma-HCH transport system substrate-binding protein